MPERINQKKFPVIKLYGEGPGKLTMGQIEKGGRFTGTIVQPNEKF